MISVDEPLSDDAINDISAVNQNPSSYKAVAPPICEECKELDLSFFDPTCPGCQDILKNPQTSIAQIFAIMRQWVPQTQQNIDLLINEILSRGAHVNDRDGLTDMNLLHYAAKSGTIGVGNIDVTCRVVEMLLKRGADVYAKCQWTDMSPLHLAVFFDAERVVRILLEATKAFDIDCGCKEFDNGTALHIGCTNLSLQSVRTLLKYGSSPHFPNKSGKLPIQCIPKIENLIENSLEYNLALDLKSELTKCMESSNPNDKKHNLSLSTLQALGLEMHDQVLVAGKVGVLRFCGSTSFASGQWAGIELSEANGKNDGSIGGVRYFTCQPKHGIFAPLTRIRKYNNDVLSSSFSSSSESSRRASLTPDKTSLNICDRVVVAGQKVGAVRYVGPTKFAQGVWIGVELEQPSGKNNGTVAGVQYFKCSDKYGVFAPTSKVQRLLDEDSTMDLTQVSSDDSVSKLEEKSNKVVKAVNRKINFTTPSLAKPRSPPKQDITLGAKLNFTLNTGMSVYVNNEVGTVKFIGQVHFADDVWLGVELRKPNGKNDGTVGGKKYFTCKPQHGLMVRASRATCRGINCSQLINMRFR